MEVSVLWRCLSYRGVHKEGVDCYRKTLKKGSFSFRIVLLSSKAWKCLLWKVKWDKLDRFKHYIPRMKLTANLCKLQIKCLVLHDVVKGVICSFMYT